MNLPAKINTVLTAFFCLLTISTSAQLKIAEAFSDNMVLQRDKPVTIWGSSNAGQQVIVQFASQQKETFADSMGKWKVIFEPFALSATPQNLIIISGNEPTLTLKNILVGDVWLCSGQSNMEYPLDRKPKRYAFPARGADKAETELTATQPGEIRFLYVEKNLGKFPVLPTRGWTDGNDTMVKYVSATGYFFARNIYYQTKVPIGIISSSWGGTRIEQWQPDWSYENAAAFKDSVTGPKFTIDGIHPGQMYKGMIAPLVPLAIKGVLWYQGESNAMVEDQKTYPLKFELLVNTWRSLFKDQSLPFYFVQIAPYLYSARKDRITHTATLLPGFWEAQTKCLQIKNTGMVVTTDLVDNLKDIHPSYKWIVGYRLALIALAKDYGQKDLVYSGPQFEKLKLKHKSIVLYFKNTGTGLITQDSASLNWFSIAGKDGQFVNADAVIMGKKVIVRSALIAKPKYVRFAWDEKAQPNLMNKEGLPAVPFRTGL